MVYYYYYYYYAIQSRSFVRSKYKHKGSLVQKENICHLIICVSVHSSVHQQVTSRLLARLGGGKASTNDESTSSATSNVVQGFTREQVDSIVEEKLQAERTLWQRKVNRLLNERHVEDFSSAKIIAHTDGLIQTNPLISSRPPASEYLEAEQALIDCYRQNLGEPLKCHQCVDRLRQLVRNDYLTTNDV